MSVKKNPFLSCPQTKHEEQWVAGMIYYLTLKENPSVILPHSILFLFIKAGAEGCGRESKGKQ